MEPVPGPVTRAVVALETPIGKGTGFCVAPGVIVTCAHVVASELDDLPSTVHVPGWPEPLTCAPEDYHRSGDGLDLAFLHWPGSLPPVLMLADCAVGDPMWTFGHPDSRFRGGQPALLSYQGRGRLLGPDGIEIHRVLGAPVHAGASGSPVVNLATGAVCGILCLSGGTGSAHFLGVDEILKRCPEARPLGLVHEPWLERLTDEQIARGRWPFPGPTLREYLRFAVKAADNHPYPGVVPGLTPPPLSDVYVQPLASSTDRAEPMPAKSIIDSQGDAVLIGEAGSGKSNFLRVEIKTMIDRYQRGADHRVPVRVAAAELVAARPLPDLIAEAVNADLSTVGFGQRLTGDLFRNPPAAAGRWLLLVDGLDELMHGEQRDALLAKLFAPAEQRQFDLIVATRPLAEPAAIPDGIDRFALLPFTTAQVLQFAEGWFTSLGLPDPAAAAAGFADRLRADAVADLAQSPLVATMLCQIHAADAAASLPSGRTRLYETFIRLLNERRFSRTSSGIRQQLKATLEPYGQDAEDVGESLLTSSQELVARLAYARQRGSTAAAVELLAEWTDHLRPGNVPPGRWRELLAGLLRRSGQLTQRHDEFHFLHQTLEEYLAARHVAEDAHRTQVELAEVFDAASWKTGAVTVVCRFSFEMADLKHVEHLLDAVRRVDGVVDCYRVTSH